MVKKSEIKKTKEIEEKPLRIRKWVMCHFWMKLPDNFTETELFKCESCLFLLCVMVEILLFILSQSYYSWRQCYQWKYWNAKKSSCLAYCYWYGSEFYNWWPIFLKKSQSASYYHCDLKVLDSLPLFFLLLSFCYLVTSLVMS